MRSVISRTVVSRGFRGRDWQLLSLHGVARFFLILLPET